MKQTCAYVCLSHTARAKKTDISVFPKTQRFIPEVDQTSIFTIANSALKPTE